MPNSFGLKITSFSRVFPVMLIVSILFQLLLAKEKLDGFASIWNEVLNNIGISLTVALVASGAFALFKRKEDAD